MQVNYIYFDRGYLKKNIPGLPPVFPISAIPFWGEYSLLDFAFFNGYLPENRQISGSRIILCNREIKREISSVASRWGDSFAEVIAIDHNNDFDFSSLKITGDYVVLYDINNASLISETGRQAMDFSLNGISGNDIVKYSIDNVPVDIYSMKTETFLSMAGKNILTPSENKDFYESLFDEVLVNLYERTVNLDGNVYFNNNITQFYESNIMLLDNNKKSSLMSEFILLSPAPANKESVISNKGLVVNSIISSNVKIEGYVENSIVFSDVVVKSDSKIINSVILNGNQIARECVITNALLFPNMKTATGTPNIQEKSVIGGNSKKAANNIFPEQITNGLTFIGANSIIPKKFNIEPGAFLGPDVPAARLKKEGKIPRSGTIQ